MADQRDRRLEADAEQLRADASLDMTLSEDCHDVRELRMWLAAMAGRVYGLADLVKDLRGRLLTDVKEGP